MMSMPRHRAVLALGFVLSGSLIASSSAVAAGREIDGVVFPDRHVIAGEPLELRGAAVLRWRVLFRAYAAGLYVPPATPVGDVLGNVPKRLEIEYFWPIGAEDFGRAADQLLRETLDEGTLERLRPRLDELHEAFEPILPGDRYALTYHPVTGTELSKNGRPLAVIHGADFAAAYFSMWLGERPIDLSMREALLGSNPMRARE